MNISQAKIILLVEDHPMIGFGIEAILNKKRYQLKTCHQSLHALKKMTQIKPDLLITDLMMPEMDGLTLIKSVRKTNLSLPILVFSGANDTHTVLQAVQLGIQGYLLKEDIDDSRFALAIQTILSGQSFYSPRIKDIIISDYQKRVSFGQITGGSYGKYNLNGLSTRKKEIIKLMCKGHSVREISNHLGISISTVNGHKADIIKKFNLQNQNQLIHLLLSDNETLPG